MTLNSTCLLSPTVRRIRQRRGGVRHGKMHWWLKKMDVPEQTKNNDDKTEFLIGSRQQLVKINPCTVRVGTTDIKLTVSPLGMRTNSHLFRDILSSPPSWILHEVRFICNILKNTHWNNQHFLLYGFIFVWSRTCLTVVACFPIMWTVKSEDSTTVSFFRASYERDKFDFSEFFFVLT